MRFSNVSLHGEQCMMTLMVDLIFLVICIYERASGMKTIGTGSTSSGGDEGMRKISMLHFPYAGSMNKSHVYTRVPADTVVYALRIRELG